MAVRKELIEELLANRNPEEVFAQDGLLDELKKALAERILNAEMDQHLAAERADEVIGEPRNHRNGHSRKTVLTGTGKLDLQVPRDRQASFEPQLIAKYRRRFPDFDDKVVSLYARGMTVREIQGHLRELYGVEVSPDLISVVTDAVLEQVAEWQNRPLDALYALVFFDALRGSGDFADLASYRRFVDEVIGHANARRHKALEIERAKLKPLPSRRTDDHEEELVIVTRSSGFFLRRIFYTVPSRLIGHRLRVRLYDERLECLLCGTLVLTLPRGRIPKGRAARGRCGHVVDYRHVIHALRRKPMALLNLVYRDQLFPRDAFRHAWDRLVATQSSGNACRTMVGLLALAHDRACEAELATALDAILDAGEVPDLTALQRRFMPTSVTVPDVTVTIPAAMAYDALLSAPQMGLPS